LGALQVGLGACDACVGLGELWLAQCKIAGLAVTEGFPVGGGLLGLGFFLGESELCVGEFGSGVSGCGLVVGGINFHENIACSKAAAGAKVVGHFDDASTDFGGEIRLGAREDSALAFYGELDRLWLHFDHFDIGDRALGGHLCGVGLEDD